MPIRVAYDYHRSRFRHRAVLSGGRARLESGMTDGNDHTARVVFGDLRYAYARRLYAAPTHRWSLFGGGFLSAALAARTYRFDELNKTATWEAESTLGAWVIANVHLAPRHEVSFSLSVPLLAYVSRSPYAVTGDELFRTYFERGQIIRLGRVVTLGRRPFVLWESAYAMRFSEKMHASIHHQLSVGRYPSPRPTSTVVSTAGLSLFLGI